MVLPPGARIGPYEVLAPIGAGGMGEVYRARDSRLERLVAIKVLPASFVGSSEATRRFEREARIISSLNHPHICTLFDVGSQDGAPFLVMEYLDGPTLAEMLRKGPLPLPQALGLAGQLADALDKAHRQGIVHRDLKPGNIIVTKSGAKLLDFGLARLRDAPPPSPDESATIVRTQPGFLIGTPQYMAPEQVEGREADSRTDIFALCSVIYEMLTGRTAFAGASTGELMSAILRGDPPSLEGVPPLLRGVLIAGWSRDPDERWQSAADLRTAIRVASAPSLSSVSGAAPKGMSRRELLISAIVGAVAGGAGGFSLARLWSRPVPMPARIRFAITDRPPAFAMNLFQSPPRISPDGTMVAFCAGPRQTIWIRMLESMDLRELADTDNALSMFWSADSKQLAFFHSDQLMRISVDGQPAERICKTPPGLGGAWNRDGVILFAHGINGPLHRVAAAGGESVPATALTAGQLRHVEPSFFADQQTFLFTAVSGAAEAGGIFAGTLGSTAIRRVSSRASAIRLAPNGYALFNRDSDLVAQRFDPASLSLEGSVLMVARAIWTTRGFGRFDVSTTGTVVYAEANTTPSQVSWVDRAGRPLAAIGPAGPYIHVDLSRDEQQVLVERLDGDVGTLFRFDGARGVPTPLTDNARGWAFTGFWSPDGADVAFNRSEVEGSLAIVRRDRTGAETVLLRSGPATLPPLSDWSADGRFLVFSALDVSTKTSRLETLDVTEKSGKAVTPRLYLSGQYPLGQGRLSPDGRFMAYVSSETGSPEVYLSPFPDPTAKWRISPNGGLQPRWRNDGKELFFLTPSKMLMAVMMDTPDRPGTPTPLFRTDFVLYGTRADYAPSRDGQRFLVNNRVAETGPQILQVLVGWRPEA